MQHAQIKKTLTLLTALFAISVGAMGCQKSAEETHSVANGTNEDVMSAEPAEDTTPAIVASDLDDADALHDDTQHNDALSKGVDSENVQNDALQVEGADRNAIANVEDNEQVDLDLAQETPSQ